MKRSIKSIDIFITVSLLSLLSLIQTKFSENTQKIS